LRRAIDEVAELAHNALLEMRASIFELRGDALAEQGLVAALRAHAGALSLRREVRVGVEGPEERLPVSAEVEGHLYRIGQEAITNAVKHAGAGQVAARVELAPGLVELSVRDDGAGFDPRRPYAGHLGLELMRTRAAEAGGTLTIDSAPGRGTEVRVSVALAPVSDPGAPAPPARPAAPPASVT
jgi:signal transduction histidine kinase